ncbi:hypothetical protein ON010_g7191 [Phytophthora cinnamomi]|nr:hypothetical protein ON010_g7191 [Phytophthora cinnamomi]
MSFLHLEHSYQAMKNLREIFAAKKEELGVVSYMTIVIVLTSSTTIFFLENPAQPEVFSSIGTCSWWAIETITSLGYGDIVPITAAGRAFSSLLALCLLCCALCNWQGDHSVHDSWCRTGEWFCRGYAKKAGTKERASDGGVNPHFADAGTAITQLEHYCLYRKPRLAEDRPGFTVSNAVVLNAAVILLHSAQLPGVRRPSTSDRTTSRASRQAHRNSSPAPSAVESSRDPIADNHDTSGAVSS